MRLAKRGDSGEAQRLGPRLDQIVDLNHPLVKLAQRIDRNVSMTLRHSTSRFRLGCCLFSGVG